MICQTPRLKLIPSNPTFQEKLEVLLLGQPLFSEEDSSKSGDIWQLGILISRLLRAHKHVIMKKQETNL